MKSYFLKISMLLFSCSVFAQNDSISVHNSRAYFNAYNDYMKSVSFRIGAGVFVPQGELKDYLGASPMFELNVNFPLKNSKSIDAVVQFVIPNQQSNFLYLRTIDTIQAKSTFMFNGLLKFKKRIYVSAKSEIHLGLGVGLSSITTDARNPFYEGEDDENKYELINSILIMPGLEFTHSFSDQAKFTVALDVQYSPYKIEGALRENIGSFGIIPKVLYKF